MFFRKRFIKKEDMRCAICATEWKKPELQSSAPNCCPTCGGRSSLDPHEIKEDVTITMNWQDFRTLAIYAKRWTAFFNMKLKADQDHLKALNRIFAILMTIKPVGADPLLIPEETVTIHLAGRQPRQGMVEDKTNQDGPIEFKKDAHGNIISPFYRGLPPIN